MCNVCIDLLPARQLLLHCMHSNTFTWVVPNEGYHNKARRSFCLHAQKEPIATRPGSGVPKLIRMSLKVSIVAHAGMQINLRYFSSVCGLAGYFRLGVAEYNECICKQRTFGSLGVSLKEI